MYMLVTAMAAPLAGSAAYYVYQTAESLRAARELRVENARMLDKLSDTFTEVVTAYVRNFMTPSPRSTFDMFGNLPNVCKSTGAPVPAPTAPTEEGETEQGMNSTTFSWSLLPDGSLTMDNEN